MSLSRRQRAMNAANRHQENRRKVNKINRTKHRSILAQETKKKIGSSEVINPAFVKGNNKKPTKQSTHDKRTALSNIVKAHEKVRQHVAEIPKSLRTEPKIDNSPTLPPIKIHSYDLSKLTKIVYTCITNSYDVPKRPEFVTEGWRYILFTDTPNLHVMGWEVIQIETPDNLDPVRLARRVKTMYWEYLPEHDFSIWIDANVKLRDDLYEFCNCIMDDEHLIWITKHPQRQCVYQEAQACKELNKDSEKLINAQVAAYKKEGMPELYGLVETNVLLRKDAPELRELMKKWFEQIKSHSRRDQLSFNYVLWKSNNNHILKTFNRNTRDKYLEWRGGHKK